MKLLDHPNIVRIYEVDLWSWIEKSLFLVIMFWTFQFCSLDPSWQITKTGYRNQVKDLYSNGVCIRRPALRQVGGSFISIIFGHDCHDLVLIYQKIYN